MTGDGALELPTDFTEVEIRSLTARGRLDEAEALYRERAPRLDPSDAVAAAGAVVEGHEQMGALARAEQLLGEVQTDLAAALAGPLAAEVEIGFRNTAGNVLRHSGRFSEALEQYAAAEPRLEETRDRLRWSITVYANWAQGLQQAQAHNEAIGVFTHVARMDPPTAILADMMASISDSLSELGRFEEAADIAERALGLVPADAPREPPFAREHALATLVRAYAELGDRRAGDAARELAGYVPGGGDAIRAGWALATAARSARRRGDAGWEELASQAREQLAEGRRAVSDHEPLRRDLIAAEARLLEALGDADGLDRLIQATDAPELAVLTSMIALRAETGELERAGPEIAAAWATVLHRVVGSGALRIPDVDRLRSIRDLRDWAAEHAFLAYDRDGGDELVLLNAAELQSSPLGGFLTWPIGADVDPVKRLAPRALLAETRDAEVVFAVRAGSAVRMVRVQDEREEVIFECDASELELTRREVRAVTRRASPTGDPLSHSARWTQLSDALGAALHGRLERDRHVVFVLGSSLDGLPLHAVRTPEGPLCRTRGCSYVASLLQLAGVRARHSGGSAPPGRGGVVAVWRTRDLPDTQAAFEHGREAFAELLRSHGIAVETLSGRDGTAEAVGALLTRSDLLYLSCHGVGGADGRHALLLAGEDQLPPMLVRPDPLPDAPDFLLRWDELPDQTPAVVLSAACSSSSGSISPGGERVSLDRALLASGTRTFVGPLWDVAVEDSTAFSVDVAARVLDAGVSWAEAWQATIDDSARTMSPASWQSFILVGDWR